MSTVQACLVNAIVQHRTRVREKRDVRSMSGPLCDGDGLARTVSDDYGPFLRYPGREYVSFLNYTYVLSCGTRMRVRSTVSGVA